MNKQQSKKPERINNDEAVAQFRNAGGNIIHVRPELPEDRGMTFAYVRQGSRIVFSTAVQHRADVFTKKMGTRIAIEHFLQGKTVTLPFSNFSKPLHLFHAIRGCCS